LDEQTTVLYWLAASHDNPKTKNQDAWFPVAVDHVVGLSVLRHVETNLLQLELQQ
jgi:hypothetical protein